MQYEIDANKDLLIAKTNERLNFEPKDWRVNFKQDIIKSLKSMTPQKQFLFAKLQTAEKDFFDVENVLFYNIGPSEFRKFDTNGVWFVLDRHDNSKEYKYIHQYGFIDSIVESRNSLVAEWKNVIVDRPSTSKKPLDYWIAFKKSDKVTIRQHDFLKEFGVYIEIYKPINQCINIINIQKPLLDGVISAFHGISHIEPIAMQYLSLHTGLSYNTISSYLKSDLTCLPKREVIQKYRDGIKWNPQDEKCIDVRIVVKNSDDENYRLSGNIFSK